LTVCIYYNGYDNGLFNGLLDFASVEHSIRYVTVKKNDEGRPSSLHIQESFLGFTEVESQKDQELAFLITKETESVTGLRPAEDSWSRI